jgi:CDP-diglyceride synthetase
VRLGAALLASAAVLWTQPVLRNIYLGQVNLVLVALTIWDLCQPSEGRWWKGIGTGIAAGIKLTPLVFIPYLLVTRRYREAIMTAAGFAGTWLIACVFAVAMGMLAAALTGLLVSPISWDHHWVWFVVPAVAVAGHYAWHGGEPEPGLLELTVADVVAAARDALAAFGRQAV